MACHVFPLCYVLSCLLSTPPISLPVNCIISLTCLACYRLSFVLYLVSLCLFSLFMLFCSHLIKLTFLHLNPRLPYFPHFMTHCYLTRMQLMFPT